MSHLRQTFLNDFADANSQTAPVSIATSSVNFPQAGASQSVLGGASDAFVTRLSGNGAGFDFSTYLGGSGNDSANGVATDANGFAYVTGQTASSNFPIESPIAGQASLNGSSDAFLAGFSPAGQRVYSSFLGGSAADSGVAVAVGNPLTLHVLGNTFSSDFPTQTPLFASALGPQDGFVARLGTLTLAPAPWGSRSSLLLGAGLLLGVGLLMQSRRQGPAPT